MSTSVTLLTLPHDALKQSLSYLSAKDLATLALANKFLYQVSNDIVDSIIQEIRKTYFPVNLSQGVRVQIPYSNLKRLLHRLTSTQIYNLGGAFNSDQVNCYLPKSESWHMSSDLRRERERCGAVVVRGYLVAVSGESDDSTSTAEIYSPIENLWAPLPSVPQKIRGMACVTVGDNVLSIGGYDVTRNEATSSSHALNLESSSKKISGFNDISWVSQEDVLLEARYAHSAVVYNNQIWVAGGTTNSDLYSNEVEALVYKNGSLESVSMMPAMCHGRRNFQLMVVKDKIYAVGGDEEGTIECFNPDTEEWSIITSFPSFKQNYSATTDGENIYIFGGQNKRKQFLSSWECYSVISEHWTITNGRMPSSDSAGYSHGSALTLNFENMKW